ncbi:MAG: hypothetical protein ACYCWW_08560, partial [Deltaproteobacteria bacterium]
MRQISLAALALSFAACGHAPPTDADAGFGDVTYSAGPFTVAAGTEKTMCTFVRGTNTQDVDVQSFLAQQSVGGHHLIVYTVDHPIDLAPVECPQGGQPDWAQVAGTQDSSQLVTLPSGVGFHVKAKQQFVMETHYINATTAPETVQSSFSLKYAPAGTVTQEAHPYFFGTQNIDIPPNQPWSHGSSCSPPQPITIYSMAGHIHARGTSVTVGLVTGLDGGTETPLYETQQWDSPPATIWDGGLPLGTNQALHVT